MKVRSVIGSDPSSARLLDQVRLFRNHPSIRWQHRIHEQILPSVRQLGGRVYWTPIIIDHAGYQDEALRRRKLDRNWRLLQLEFAERPDDPFTLFNLGWTALDLGRTEEAIPYLQRSLELSEPDSSIVGKLHVLVSQSMDGLGRFEEALHSCRQGRRLYPDDAELLLQEGRLLHRRGTLDEAAARFVRLLTSKAGDYFASTELGLRSFRACDHLARVYRDQNHFRAAETQWRLAVQERDDYVPAWIGLGQLYLHQQNQDALERLLTEMEVRPALAIDKVILQARWCCARKQFHSARILLEDLIPTVPNSIGPRLLLAHVLSQEGGDTRAAEHVYRQILALAPNHAEAHQRLVFLANNHVCKAQEDRPSSPKNRLPG